MDYFNLIDNDLIIYILKNINKNYSFIIHCVNKLFCSLTPKKLIILHMDIAHNTPELIIPYINCNNIKNENILLKMYLYGGYLKEADKIYSDDLIISRDIIYEGLISGKMKTVEWLSKNVSLDRNEYLYPPVRYGYLDIIKYLIDKGLVPDERVMWNAIDMSRVGVVKYLLDINCPISMFETGHAVRKGNLEIIDMFYNNGYVYDIEDMEIACEMGNYNTVEKLLSYGIGINTKCFSYAIKSNNYSVIKKIIDMKIGVNKLCLFNAIYYCNLENRDLIFDNYEIIPYCYEAAIVLNSVDLCQYIYDRGVRFNNKIFPYAIMLGKDNVWEWLYSKGCPYDAECYKSILMCGYKDAICFLDKIGCKPDIECLRISIKYSKIDILLYFTRIVKKYCNGINKDDLYMDVKNRGDPEVIYIINDMFK